MVIVRAKFPQGWRGNHYQQDEKIPATEEQGKRLVQAGVAYYDFKDESKPTDDNTVPEIKQWLDMNLVEYDSSMRKNELLELVNDFDSN